MRKTPTLVLAVLATVATACSSGGGSESGPAPAGSAEPSAAAATATPTESDCATDYLAGLTMRQKLGQLLTVGVTGVDDAANVVGTEQVGGIFIGGWTDEALLSGGQLEQIKQSADSGLMVTIDEEGGRVSRVSDLIGEAPSARQAAQTMSADEFYDASVTRGRALKDLGITVDFAPDVDVSDQPDDSVIGDRSFSDDPEKVTEYADAQIRAFHEVGIGAVIKHFPGHGHGSGDSHTGGVETPPLDQLQDVDLEPFRQLVGSGAGVMVGHLDVPGLTEPDVPASISPQAMALLRQGSGYNAEPFDGPIFTDDLGGMAAISDRLPIPDAVETALEAGADNALWISSDAVPQVLDQLEEAVSAGRLSSAQVDASVLRMAKFKGVPTGC
ncbi:glycoside hydrolase family 3 N-terminal domain-containing protein [Nocardia callitridis]|uniref:beta-N-acetylhexosaminidase n=1 Tax=Nocardia callitridis TaxID=648753 RepID=A0ABP9JZX3_9NOCA